MMQIFKRKAERKMHMKYSSSYFSDLEKSMEVKGEKFFFLTRPRRNP
jgi:hypothetical protein